MIAQNLGQLLNLIPLHPTAVRTATATGTGIDITDYVGELAVILDSAAGTGTAPTLDVKLQDSDAVGGTYADIAGATFTQVITAAGAQKIAVKVDAINKFIRAVGTIGGTGPSFAFSVKAVGVKQVRT